MSIRCLVLHFVAELYMGIIYSNFYRVVRKSKPTNFKLHQNVHHFQISFTGFMSCNTCKYCIYRIINERAVLRWGRGHLSPRFTCCHQIQKGNVPPSPQNFWARTASVKTSSEDLPRQLSCLPSCESAIISTLAAASSFIMWPICRLSNAVSTSMSPRFISTTTTVAPFSSRSGAARWRSAYAVPDTGSDDLAHVNRYSLPNKLTLRSACPPDP